jgi:hypothetical protein
MLTHHAPAHACLLAVALLAHGCGHKPTPSGDPAQPATHPALVYPTAFGPESRGLRLGIAAQRARYSVGEPIWLTAAVHNTSAVPITFRPPLPSGPEVTLRHDLITLEYSADDAQRITLARDGAWSAALSGPLSLAPGAYRLRVLLTADELPASSDQAAPPAWHGRLTSNELAIEVRGAAP